MEMKKSVVVIMIIYYHFSLFHFCLQFHYHILIIQEESKTQISTIFFFFDLLNFNFHSDFISFNSYSYLFIIIQNPNLFIHHHLRKILPNHLLYWKLSILIIELNMILNFNPFIVIFVYLISLIIILNYHHNYFWRKHQLFFSDIAE